MTAFLNILRIIVSLLPAIIQLIRTIEEAIPLNGIGADKLVVVKGIVEDAYGVLDAEQQKTLNLPALISAVVSIANRIVGLFNKTGWPK